LGDGVVLAVLLVASYYVLRVVDENRLLWRAQYINLSQDITRSGCTIAEAADGGYFVYDCRWHPADPVAYGCGWLQNGSAALMDKECLARGPQ
jgi:hypothetical protein